MALAPPVATTGAPPLAHVALGDDPLLQLESKGIARLATMGKQQALNRGQDFGSTEDPS